MRDFGNMNNFGNWLGIGLSLPTCKCISLPRLIHWQASSKEVPHIAVHFRAFWPTNYFVWSKDKHRNTFKEWVDLSFTREKLLCSVFRSSVTEHYNMRWLHKEKKKKSGFWPKSGKKHVKQNIELDTTMFCFCDTANYKTSKTKRKGF